MDLNAKRWNLNCCWNLVIILSIFWSSFDWLDFGILSDASSIAFLDDLVRHFLTASLNAKRSTRACNNMKYFIPKTGNRQLQTKHSSNQGIIDLNRNGNFCKKICKIIARAQVDSRVVLLKKSTGFRRISVTASLLRLGALLRDK